MADCNMLQAAIRHKQKTTAGNNVTGESTFQKTPEEQDKENEENSALDKILAKEQSHFQWLKHSFCLIVLAS